MDIHQIEAFLKIIVENGFTKAASKLFLTQPSISKRIRTLEAEIGCPLFYRKQGKTSLTPAGETLLPYAKEIMQGFNNGIAAIQAMNEKKRHLHFGTTTNLGTYVTPNIISLLYKKYPALHLDIQTARSNELIEMLLNHTIDAAMITDSPIHAKLHCIPVMNDPILCIASSKLAISRLRQITLKQLERQQIIVYDPKFPFWSPLKEEFQKRNINLRISLQLDRAESIKQLVKSGMGISFLPTSCIQREIAAGELAVLALADYQLPTKVISLITSKQNTNPLTKSLITVVRAVHRSHRLTKGELLGSPP